MKLRKVYPANLKPGMLVVGMYDPDAPTNPVQEMAAGLRVNNLVHWIEDKSARECAVAPLWANGLGQGPMVEYSSGIKYLVIED